MPDEMSYNTAENYPLPYEFGLSEQTPEPRPKPKRMNKHVAYKLQVGQSYTKLPDEPKHKLNRLCHSLRTYRGWVVTFDGETLTRIE